MTGTSVIKNLLNNFHSLDFPFENQNVNPFYPLNSSLNKLLLVSVGFLHEILDEKMQFPKQQFNIFLNTKISAFHFFTIFTLQEGF